MIKKNDIIKLEITSITNLGFGVGRHEGLVIFVSGAVTGDTAEVKIIKLAPSYAVGRVENFTKKSPLRDEKRCTLDACSSCAYKRILYNHEKKSSKKTSKRLL